MTVLWRCRVGSGLPRAGRLVEALLRVGLRDARGGAAGSCQRSRRQPFQPPQQIKRPIHVERSLGRGAAERRDRSLARLGSAPLTTVSPAGPLALVLLAPSSAPVPLCSVLAALGERVRGMWQGRGRPMGVGGTGSVPRVPRARRQHPICAAGQGWPWRWQVRDGCIAAARPACPACPCLSCLPCLPLPSDHGSEAATEERLHHPRCGKMVSSRSRSRSGSALSPGTLRPRD